MFSEFVTSLYTGDQQTLKMSATQTFATPAIRGTDTNVMLDSWMPEPPNHAGRSSTRAEVDNATNLSFRVETKKVYVCTHGACYKTCSRMPDVRRHHRGAHQDDRRFTCRALGCERAIRDFPRMDKRNAH